MLDLVEKTFNQVPLLIQMEVVFTRFFAVFTRRDHRFCSILCNPVQEFLRVIRAIRDHPLKIKIGNQVFGLRDIVALPCGQEKP